MENHTTIAQWVGNVSGAGAIIASMLGYLPAMGALIAIVWYAIQIRESDTYKEWRNQRQRDRIAKLERELTRLKSSQLPTSQRDA